MNDPTPPDSSSHALPAYILAGGQSRRFGSDKARALAEGRPMIVHVADALAQVAISVTAIAQEPGHYADLGLETIADSAADRGPVQGLFAALVHRTQTHGAGWLLLAACDMLPEGPSSFAALLESLDALPESCNAIAGRTDRWHPMPGLYHTRLLPTVAAYLADGGRTFQELLAKPDAATLAPRAWPDRPPMRLHANTPEQLRDGLAQHDSGETQ